MPPLGWPMFWTVWAGGILLTYLPIELFARHWGGAKKMLYGTFFFALYLVFVGLSAAPFTLLIPITGGTILYESYRRRKPLPTHRDRLRLRAHGRL